MFGATGRRHGASGDTFVDRVAKLTKLRHVNLAAQRHERRRRGEIEYTEAVEAMAAYNRRDPGAVRPPKVDVAAALRATRRTWATFYTDVFAALNEQSTEPAAEREFLAADWQQSRSIFDEYDS